MSYNPVFVSYNDASGLTVILENNIDVLLSLMTGSTYRLGSYTDFQGHPVTTFSAPSGDITDYNVTTSTTTVFYIPTKIIQSVTGYQDYGQGLVANSPTYSPDNVRYPFRLAKFLYKYTSGYKYNEILTMAESSISYLFSYYSQFKHLPNSNLNVYQLPTSDPGYNDPSALIPMVAAIDALAYVGVTLSSYSATIDPRTYWLPSSSNPNVPVSQVNSARLNSGYASYIDLYGLRNVPGSLASTYRGSHISYPFFDTTSGSQQLGLGMISFLLTNEGLTATNAFPNYLGIDMSKISSQYSNISVYSQATGTSTYSLVQDIITTFWILGYLGNGSDPKSYAQSAYMTQYLIDGVNYSGSPTTWSPSSAGQPLTTANGGLLSNYPSTTFEIWACCDTSWQYDTSSDPTALNYSGTSKSNFCDVTMEMFSYAILIAAITKDYDKFCKFHRYFHYLLYLQNGVSTSGGKMGDANTQTYDYTPANGPSNGVYTFRNQANSVYGKNPWLYVSYCAGYKPYANFYGKINTSSGTYTDATNLTGPSFIMSNPYWQNAQNDLYSASDADLTICLAYKIAANNATTSGWYGYDRAVAILPTTGAGSVSQTAKYMVGADSSITWTYMYTQIKETILAQTGHQSLGTTNGPIASNFYPGVILSGQYLITQGHDTGVGSPELHPDYMDLALFRDWLNEANAACFLEGTKILTERGYVPIEKLTTTDMVVSCGDIHNNKFCERNNRVVPIRWVGKYTKKNPCRRHQPLCITKNAFSMGMPFEEVHLSGNHGVVLFGKLVPLKKLLNDSTVYRVPVDTAVYYHIEVEGHQCIMANGVRAETYLDHGSRVMFETVFLN
jgi:hypothetical protein